MRAIAPRSFRTPAAAGMDRAAELVEQPGLPFIFLQAGQDETGQVADGHMGAEPVTGSKLPTVEWLQFFLSESVREPGRVTDAACRCCLRIYQDAAVLDPRGSG